MMKIDYKNVLFTPMRALNPMKNNRTKLLNLSTESAGTQGFHEGSMSRKF